MSLYLGNNLISGVATPVQGARNIGQIIQSTIPLTDAGLHLLDGSVINGSGAYADFVDYIAGLVSTYPDLFETEANWQTSVTNYGVCGKFVYDSVNNTVRLPKITGFIEGTIDSSVLGDLINAGLPNITGNSGNPKTLTNAEEMGNPQGAFYVYDQTSNDYGNTQGSAGRWSLGFDASRSNSIYGNSTTVQPQSIKVLYYIVIATSTKTQIEVDIDEIATDLNGKVDKADLTEVQVVVETYQSGTSWYRLYSDGWCEQGGYLTSNGTVNLLKSYRDTNYSVTGGLVPGNPTATYEHMNFESFTTSSFYFYTYDGYKCFWQACGYTS